ncbi:hypothetical protein [Undibacterium sp. TS12]|uniref:hypothetical protein n=1 Tax=Undibacterium sp. TS12 TaxID=2908202 RepID=UPI001F4CA4B7|nr:hypothetical protein [Undibacterium sp. TS12]MCH8622519.1 hypothetical protein [Undibacterium sp. TS12]
MKESSDKCIPGFMPGAGQAIVYDDAANGKPVAGIAGQSCYDNLCLNGDCKNSGIK